MELYEVMEKRHSIRAFQPREVEEEKVKRILQSAILAPSAGNLQPWEFILVKDEKMKRKLADAALGQNFIQEAPVVIVVCANRERSGRIYGTRGSQLYSILDSAIAATYILLSVTNEGLGSCWVGAFRDDEVSRALGLPEDIRPIGIFPIGYPAEEPFKTSRFPLSRVLHKEKW
jgi:nitroreductase